MQCVTGPLTSLVGKYNFESQEGGEIKVRIETTIDSELKRIFEDAKGILNLTYGDILEAGIREKLLLTNQSNLIDAELEKTKIEISEKMQRQARLESLKEQISQISGSTKNNGVEHHEHQAELEELRESKFLKTKDSTTLLWKKGELNWERIIPAYRFRNKAEAKAWFDNRIVKENGVI